MFGHLFVGRGQNAPSPQSSFRVISVTRQSGVNATAAQGSPIEDTAQSAPVPSAIDCFHEADDRSRRRHGTRASQEDTQGLPAPRGVRPRNEAVPTRWLAVFAGASNVAPHYMEVAHALGASLAAQGWGILYGGMHSGQMGALANAALAGGGWVIGVSPSGGPTSWLQYPAAGEEGLLQTPTLEQRKANMLRPSRGAVALPGGWGTFDEIGYTMHCTGKPLAFLNVSGFWDPLLEQTLNMRDERFVAPNNMCVEWHDPRTVTEVFIQRSDAEPDEGAA